MASRCFVLIVLHVLTVFVVDCVVSEQSRRGTGFLQYSPSISMIANNNIHLASGSASVVYQTTNGSGRSFRSASTPTILYLPMTTKCEKLRR